MEFFSYCFLYNTYWKNTLLYFFFYTILIEKKTLFPFATTNQDLVGLNLQFFCTNNPNDIMHICYAVLETKQTRFI